MMYCIPGAPLCLKTSSFLEKNKKRRNSIPAKRVAILVIMCLKPRLFYWSASPAAWDDLLRCPPIVYLRFSCWKLAYYVLPKEGNKLQIRSCGTDRGFVWLTACRWVLRIMYANMCSEKRNKMDCRNTLAMLQTYGALFLRRHMSSFNDTLLSWAICLKLQPRHLPTFSQYYKPFISLCNHINWWHLLGHSWRHILRQPESNEYLSWRHILRQWIGSMTSFTTAANGH